MFRFRRTLCALSIVFVSALSGCAEVEFTDGGGAPWLCAQWPLVYLVNDAIYYADWYPDSCDDNPEAAYLVGDYDWPQYCPDCVPGDNGDFSSHRFPGLSKPIEADYVFKMPAGPASEFATPSDVPDLRYIQIQDVRGKLITAKVFAFTIHRRLALGTPGFDPGRTIVFAMQMDGEPGHRPVKLDCTPLDRTKACYAYSATYAPGAGKRFPILVLTAK